MAGIKPMTRYSFVFKQTEIEKLDSTKKDFAIILGILNQIC